MNSIATKIGIIITLILVTFGCASNPQNLTSGESGIKNSTQTLSIHKLTPEKIERKIYKKMARKIIKDEKSRQSALLLLDNKYWHIVLGQKFDLNDIDRIKIYDSQGEIKGKIKISSLGEVRLTLKVLDKLIDELQDLIPNDKDNLSINRDNTKD